MKLGIVTLYGDFNYGNRLQNYALSTVLRGMGYDVVTLVTVQKTSAIKGFYRKRFEKEGGKISSRLARSSTGTPRSLSSRAAIFPPGSSNPSRAFRGHLTRSSTPSL